MGIQFVNESAHLTAADLVRIADACNKQLHLHVAPAWGIKSPLSVSTLHHPSWYPCYLADTIPEAPGALAYHDVDDTGRPFMKIGVETTLDAGDTVSSAVSHEACELEVDRYCAQWTYSVGRRCVVATEVCDPVQDQSYTITSTDGTKVPVSNFVTPWYFVDDGHIHGYDYLDTLGGPFSVSPGGYLIVMKAGAVTNVFGESVDERKRAQREASRGRSWWRAVQMADAMSAAASD